MTAKTHYVIIGAGAAGSEAAWHLRRRDPKSRITLITAGRLLLINRYELPRVFDGVDDWRELLVHPPQYYEDHDITVRRNTWVTSVDAANKVLGLRHKEKLHYDKLLVASGGGGYLPPDLKEYAPLLHPFGGYHNAIRVYKTLPKRGTAVMIGADMIGLDLARHLVRNGYNVKVVATEHLFWPHQLSDEERDTFVETLTEMGIKVITGRKVTAIKQRNADGTGRAVVTTGGREVTGDVVMSFCGLMPSLEFMVGAGVDIERGLLVDPKLQTTDKSIWAAGDVCQIWSPEENQYRFYYGWKNVKNMGRIAALNMTGGKEKVGTFADENLVIDNKGHIDSPFWEYE